MFFRYTYPALMWAAFILLLTMTSGREFPEVTLISFDKMVHAFLFAVQSYLFVRGFMRQTYFIRLHYRPIVSSFLICILFGAATELMQAYLLNSRSGDIYDFFANTIGTGAGIGAFILLYGKAEYAKR